jgi:hypothetical protein
MLLRKFNRGSYQSYKTLLYMNLKLYLEVFFKKKKVTHHKKKLGYDTKYRSHEDLYFSVFWISKELQLKRICGPIYCNICNVTAFHLQKTNMKVEIISYAF